MEAGACSLKRPQKRKLSFRENCKDQIEFPSWGSETDPGNDYDVSTKASETTGFQFYLEYWVTLGEVKGDTENAFWD